MPNRFNSYNENAPRPSRMGRGTFAKRLSRAVKCESVKIEAGARFEYAIDQNGCIDLTGDSEGSEQKSTFIDLTLDE